MTTDPVRSVEFLRHILEAMTRISNYTAGLTFLEFSDDSQVQDAVIRNIEVMGEAARNIEQRDPTFASRHPQIPLRDVYLMRNRLAHGYFSVDLALVWNAVEADIPQLRAQIEAILHQP